MFLFLEFQKKQFQSIENAMDSLLHDDYSATISVNKKKNSLYNKTAKLLAKQKKLDLQKTSETLIFTNIIESLSIGILILRKSKILRDVQNDDGIEVFQLNNAFVDFLKIPKYYNWNLLNNKIASLTKLIDNNNWQSFKKVISLNVNNQEETFFLKTSVTKTYDYQYLILTLETIQQLIDKKEKESWYKLMNVMSHEIINTITPITSLAGNLGSLLEDDYLDKETQEELKQGLEIIKKRSHHLTSFVDSYRQLAELPTPNKEEIKLTEIVNNTLTLFKQQFKENNIIINFLETDMFIVNVDKQQIEQMIINVISNCLYALKKTKKPSIIINVSKTGSRTQLTITDNGVGISDTIKSNIFVPYFTTRKDGSGIGLSLAKSIMEAHNGNISFTSNTNKTSFVLSFLE
jgi:nitrogen fixation/metabolism regulation signal transduction histidine kinase